MVTTRERGHGLVDTLVGLFILGVVATAFLGLTGAFMRGTLSARQREAAVSCARHVVEQIRAAGGSLPGSASCGNPVFPELEFAVAAAGPGESMVTVSVYARTRSRSQLVYAVSTARYLGVSRP